MALPRDTIYITNVKPQVVIDVVGHLIKFFYRHWCKLLVLTQRVGNLSNHKKYVMNGVVREETGAHFPGTPFLQDQWPAVFTFLSVCA